MRNPLAIEARAEADRLNVDFLVPDTIMLEIGRAGRWPQDWVNDFRDWFDIQDRQWMSWGIGELLREERESGQRAATVIDQAMTDNHRQLVLEVSQDNLQRLQEIGPRFQEQAASLSGPGGALHANENFQLMRQLADVWWDLVDEPARVQLFEGLNLDRDAPLDNIGRAALSPQLDRILIEAMTNPNTGYARQAAEQLVENPTFTRFYYGAQLAFALFLRAQPRRLGEGDNADRLLNQLLDLNYASYSLCCRALQTNDRLLGRIESGLRLAAEERWV
ncbi:MAG: hypothetical protein ACE37H_03500 [Phycisphaeraceae bacterium]